MIKSILLASVAGIALMFTAAPANAQGIHIGGRGVHIDIGNPHGYPYGGYNRYNPYGGYNRYNPYGGGYNRYNPYGGGYNRYNPYGRPPVVPNYYHPRYPHYHYHNGR